LLRGLYYRFVRLLFGICGFRGSEALAGFMSLLRRTGGALSPSSSSGMYSGHMARIFPDLDETSRKGVVRGFWRTHQRAMLGLFACDRYPAEAMLDRVEWSGRDMLDEALSRGRGVLLLVPHFGDERTLHILLAMAGYPVHVISSGYEDAPGVVRRARLEATRKWHHMGLAGENPRWMYDALGRGDIVQFAPTAYGGPRGTWVELFGAPVLVPSAPARLGGSTGCAMVLGVNHALPGLRYRLEFLPFSPGMEEPGFSSELSGMMEELGRKHPDQYNWMTYCIRHRETNTIFRTGSVPADERELEALSVPGDSSPELVRSLREVKEALAGGSG
jgi:KDO2-lipid IV(A) lauroyltransferase